MSRIKSDAVDREKLRVTLCSFTDPLDPSSHPEGVVNLANGLVSTNNVNVDKDSSRWMNLKQDGQVASVRP